VSCLRPCADLTGPFLPPFTEALHDLALQCLKGQPSNLYSLLRGTVKRCTVPIYGNAFRSCSQPSDLHPQRLVDMHGRIAFADTEPEPEPTKEEPELCRGAPNVQLCFAAFA